MRNKLEMAVVWEQWEKLTVLENYASDLDL